MYQKAHVDRLNQTGIPSVTSTDEKWMENPDIHAIVMQDISTGQLLGGIRVQQPSSTHLLPMEEAMIQSTPHLYSPVKKMLQDSGVPYAELSGQWVSDHVRSRGLNVFMIKEGMKLARNLGISHLYAFVEKRSKIIGDRLKFDFLEEFGENGSFIYPLPNIESIILRLDIPRNFQ
ncbi:MAG: hypothetical protein AAGI38_18990 [Bacteroidota bacterium]